MVEMLKKRFGRDKIYLVGHSWGSLLGMIEISRHPESFYAYVGVGQFVDVTQGDRIGYDYTLNKAREVGNEAAIQELEKIGPPPYDSFDTFLTFRKWIIPMGGVFYSPTYIQDVMITDIRNASEYTGEEKENYEMGEGLLVSTIVPELPKYNLLNQIHEVKVPVYFFAGKADYNTPLKLVEKLYEQLAAPYKELFLFEKSGHAPNYEEENKFAQIMNQHVFNQTYYSPVVDKPVRIFLNGKTLNLKPLLSDGQLLLPLRHTMEELEATVQWTAAANTVLVTSDRMKATLALGSEVAESGDQEVRLSTPASLVEGSTYVTVQILEEVLHLQVDWNPAKNEMNIFSK
ncbi:stalk domain-containing protein [Paenibacillus foliorum]|nr:stalk domain-containing protein [Paenibacillus foliorum]